MSSRPRPARQIRPAPQTARELARVFFELLMRHKHTFNEAVVEMGLSSIQARTLLSIDPDRPSTMSEVAQEIGCGPSNLTGVVDKLEARDLVERRLREDDRRIKTVAMTRKGAALRRRLIERLAEPAPWMLGLSSVEQQRLVEILRRALELAPT